MIYITGDTHGDLNRFSKAFIESDGKTGIGDKLIICGDFGFIWYNEDNEKGRAYNNLQLDILAQKPYEILFIDGNHENFTELNKYPITERYGAAVHKIRDNIFHLMRGNIYTIENKSFLAFGGAYSIDKGTRIENISWWAAEQPSNEECALVLENLEKAGNKVDYILSHTAPIEAVELMKYRLPYTERGRISVHKNELKLSGFLNEIADNTEFKRWFFGHWHFDVDISEKYRALLFDTEKID